MKYKKIKNQKAMWLPRGSRPISAAKKIESAITNIFTLIGNHLFLNIFARRDAEDFQSMRDASRKNFKKHSFENETDVRNSMSKSAEAPQPQPGAKNV